MGSYMSFGAKQKTRKILLPPGWTLERPMLEYKPDDKQFSWSQLTSAFGDPYHISTNATAREKFILILNGTKNRHLIRINGKIKEIFKELYENHRGFLVHCDP